MSLGGRAAEEIVFEEATTGAANDLEKVTATAKQMVMRYGMSEKLGPRVLGHSADMPFLGRELGREPDYSNEIAREIDDEIRNIIEEAHQTALSVLREHDADLRRMADLLVERETIDKEQFERLLAGESVQDVFADSAPPASADEGKKARKPRAKPKPKPKPYTVPGALSKPPPPEAAKG
jgi:cell division protease FtsH